MEVTMRIQRTAALFLALLTGIALLAYVGYYFPRVQAQEQPAEPVPFMRDAIEENAATSSPAEHGIRSTSRISIPYGFQDTLPVLSMGQIAIARGHGGCTAGQQFTVDVTITQDAYGVAGEGQTRGTCDGELQTWHALVAAYPTNTFISGPAEACGMATTTEGGSVTDVFEWCKDVVLDALDNQIYLPIAANQ
jgi:hypothetical protein